jgi:hypothetical protein
MYARNVIPKLLFTTLPGSISGGVRSVELRQTAGLLTTTLKRLAVGRLCNMPEIVHMAETWGTRSLCGQVLKNNPAKPLSLPYGSGAVTCSACKKEFLKREKESRTLNYYSFVSEVQSNVSL